MEDQTTLFSVIIPTYNRADLLKVAIQSIIDQTESDWEIIIIDDGSTDHTSESISAISDSRIHYFHQSNKERSAARNLGIEKAKGQYVCFLDDDDYFLQDHLKILAKKIREDNYPIAILRTGMITKHGEKEIRGPFYDPKTSKHPIAFFLNHMVGIHTLCYHRKILDEYRYDERWHHFQDTHLLIRCLLDFPFFQINQYTAVYMRYPEMGSISIFRLDNAAARTENNVAAIRDLFRQGGNQLLQYLPANMETYLVAQKYLDHANGALHVGRKKLARKNFRHSLKISRGRFLHLSYLKFLVRYGLAMLKC